MHGHLYWEKGTKKKGTKRLMQFHRVKKKIGSL